MLSFDEFYRADFSFNRPFCLPMSDKKTLIAEKVLRIVPQKRMVVQGHFQSQSVVAKIFFDPKEARAHQQRDVAGIKLLQKNKIPTPDLLFEGNTENKLIYILIFTEIQQATNLQEIWAKGASFDSLLPLLQALMIEIATQHVLGLRQRDLHFSNFLITEKIIYTLDGAQIEAQNTLLSKKLSMDNLALLLSQLGINKEPYQKYLFDYYAKSRGWVVKNSDYHDLFALIKKWNVIRWKSFSKKINRNCTQFIELEHGRNRIMANRSLFKKELKEVIKNPEKCFNQENVTYLKKGRSATVIKVKCDDSYYVIKRYNIKNFFHFLSRFLRPTRAAKSWGLSQKLYLYHVPTPLPVAYVEKRYWFCRSVSYYLSQYIHGNHAGDYFDESLAVDKKNMVQEINSLLKSVAALNISHGDLKITNILVERAKPMLIDLDGAKEHKAVMTLRKAWQKELARFLKNFQQNPELQQQFIMEFQKWRHL